MPGIVSLIHAISSSTWTVVHDVAKQQFTVSLKGADDAVLVYQIDGKNIIFITTQVPGEFQGKGVGNSLAEAAFNHAQQNKLNVICQCSFLASYYEKNIDKFKDINIKFG